MSINGTGAGIKPSTPTQGQTTLTGAKPLSTRRSRNSRPPTHRSSEINGLCVQRGLTFYRKHDYSRAIADHSEAIRPDSTLASAYTGRGNAYNARGEIDRADEDFKKARQLVK
jgi:Tfp pilus assembly protein PilF